MKRILLTLVWTASLFCLHSATIPAQSAQASSSLEGTIRRADSGSTLAGAQISLTDLAATPTVIRSVIADSSGHFAFNNLMPGDYRMLASASSFAPREYGQQTPNTAGTPISLATNQKLRELTIPLMPAGTISGVVMVNDGLPAVNVPVKVTRTFYSAMGKVQQTVKSTTTDDRGRYRLYGLNPGRYFLSTGSEKLLSPHGANAVSSGDFAIQFYPGVETMERAALVEVRPGTELGIDLKTYRQRNSFVRGSIVDSATGKPPDKVNWQLLYETANGGSTAYTPQAGYDPKTGEFELSNVWLGSYVLEARTGVVNAAAIEAGEAAWAVFPVARVSIVVKDGGLDGLQLFQVTPATVRGRIRIDGVSDVPRLSGTVNLFPTERDPLGRVPPAAHIADDGDFHIDGLLAGEYSLQIHDYPRKGLYIKNIIYQGSDILNQPWRFNGSGGGTIDVILGSGTGRLTGIASNARPAPAAGARTVLLPMARNRTDLYKSAVADRSGRFSFTDVTPGEYKLFAWETIETGEEYDPEFIRQFETQGIPVHIGESIMTYQDVRVASRL